MVFTLMTCIAKFIVKSLLWSIRLMERCLEQFDDKSIPTTTPTFSQHLMKEKDMAEEIPIQSKTTVKPKREQSTDSKVEKEIILCPLCENIMQFKRAGKGGCFYSCSTWPICKGTRSMKTKKPGPAAEISRLQIIHGKKEWEEMEKKRIYTTDKNQIGSDDKWLMVSKRGP